MNRSRVLAVMPSLPLQPLRTAWLLGALLLPLTSLLVAMPQAQAQPTGDPLVRDHRTKLAVDEPEPLVVDRVVAIVNDEVILSTELMMRVAPLAFELQKISDDSERARRQAKLASQVLDEMVNEQLVSQAAATAKLEVGAKEVQAAIADLKRQNKLDDEQLEDALRMQGYSMSSYRKDVKNQILRMRAVNTLVRPRVSITEDDVRAKYDAKQRRASQVSQVKLQHILVRVPEGASEAQLRAARDKAAMIMEREKNGDEFGKLAGEFSEDPATKNTGGDLGWIDRKTMETEWEVIVFAMAKGETRGPINGPEGLHIFHVSDLKGSEQESFEDVKERLRNELYRTEMDKQTRLWVEELRKKAHFEIKL